jgi:hypothetical protein
MQEHPFAKYVSHDERVGNSLDGSLEIAVGQGHVEFRVQHERDAPNGDFMIAEGCERVVRLIIDGKRASRHLRCLADKRESRRILPDDVPERPNVCRAASRLVARRGDLVRAFERFMERSVELGEVSDGFEEDECAVVGRIDRGQLKVGEPDRLAALARRGDLALQLPVRAEIPVAEPAGSRECRDR